MQSFSVILKSAKTNFRDNFVLYNFKSWQNIIKLAHLNLLQLSIPKGSAPTTEYVTRRKTQSLKVDVELTHISSNVCRTY